MKHKYRIEIAWIPQYPGVSKEVWFLDRVETKEGRTSTSNICNGTKDYCEETLSKIAQEEHDNGTARTT